MCFRLQLEPSMSNCQRATRSRTDLSIRATQYVEGQIRTIQLDLESRTGEQIPSPSTHDLVPWLVEYAAVLLNRGRVSADGKTAYERLIGKRAALARMQFGERIQWRSSIPSKDRRFKMDSAWQQGIYLGQRTVSGEFLVGTKEGVFRPRTVARPPVEKDGRRTFPS